jgi:hypothetical protein
VTGAFQILVFGILILYALNRLTRWLYRRGWIRWRMRRGTSSALGNAMLGVQTIFEPSKREVLELRVEEADEEAASGDPPDPGPDRRARGHHTARPQ